MNKTKKELVLQTVLLLVTVIVFVGLSMFYSAQIHVDESCNGTNITENQTDKLLEDIIKENTLIFEQLSNHQGKLDSYDSLFLELNQKLSIFENTLVGINNNITVLNDNYENLNYLYSQINTQTKTDNIENNSDMSDLYYGRLHIPDAGISVALYYGWQQYITDRADSANIFSWPDYDSCTIADHNNQEFSKLFNVQVGTTGYIELKSGKIINIKCREICNGHNTGSYIIDEYGINMINKADYIVYTCIDHWTNIRICLWDMV